jgi:hypothetical protein
MYVEGKCHSVQRIPKVVVIFQLLPAFLHFGFSVYQLCDPNNSRRLLLFYTVKCISLHSVHVKIFLPSYLFLYFASLVILAIWRLSLKTTPYYSSPTLPLSLHTKSLIGQRGSLLSVWTMILNKMSG